MSTLSHRPKRAPFRKNFLHEISRKSNLNSGTAVQDCTKFPSLITYVLLQIAKDIHGVCYQRYEKCLQQQKGHPNVNVCAAEKKFERGTIIKSVFDYCFNTKKHTRVYLFVTQAFWVFIVRICFFWCEI